MDGWTIGADFATMLAGVAILTTAGVWLARQLVGQSLHSPDSRTSFILGSDANMVVQVEGYGVFDDTGTVGAGDPKCLRLELDGWLVLYDMAGRELWKRGPDSARLVVQDNALWSCIPTLARLYGLLIGF